MDEYWLYTYRTPTGKYHMYVTDQDFSDMVLEIDIHACVLIYTKKISSDQYQELKGQLR